MVRLFILLFFTDICFANQQYSDFERIKRIFDITQFSQHCIDGDDIQIVEINFLDIGSNVNFTWNVSILFKSRLPVFLLYKKVLITEPNKLSTDRTLVKPNLSRFTNEERNTLRDKNFNVRGGGEIIHELKGGPVEVLVETLSSVYIYDEEWQYTLDLLRGVVKPLRCAY